MKMSNNSANYEILIKQHLHSVLDISGCVALTCNDTPALMFLFDSSTEMSKMKGWLLFEDVLSSYESNSWDTYM